MISIQCCGRCGTLQYPCRDVCRNCLSDDLYTSEVSNEARLQAIATVHRGLEPSFADRLPLQIGTVVLDGGVRAICFVEPGLAAGDAVRIAQSADGPDGRVWTACSI